MKLSTLFAVVLGLAAIGLVLAFPLLHEPMPDGVIHVALAVLVLAAFMWNSELVDGWIRAGIAHLPFLGGKSDGGQPRG